MPDLLTPLPLALIDTVLHIVVVTVGIGFLIFIHEAGHFLVAKWNKVRVEAFSLGFGPVIWGFRRGDTHYRLSAIPLGGYVKMAGENPTEEKTDDPAEFHNKSIPARAAILVAGVVMNAVVAFLFFVIAFSVGVPLPRPVVGSVLPGSPAWKAGIRPGDRIQRVDDTRIIAAEDVLEEIAFAKGSVNLGILRDGKEIRIEDVKPIRNPTLGFQRLGIEWQTDPRVDVEEDSPAWKAGMRPGDEVVTVNGVDFLDPVAYQRTLARAKGPVTYVVRRDGKTLTFDVTPAEEQSENGSPIIGIQPVADLVAAVLPGSPAAASGLAEGDRIVAVNGKPAASLPAARALAARTGDAPVVFTVLRGEPGEEQDLAPVEGFTTLEDWDSFFDGVAASQSSLDTNVVTLMEDYSFAAGNPARQAGVVEGSRIVRVNGKETGSFEEIRNAMADAAADEPVAVSFVPPGAADPLGPVQITRRNPLVRTVGLGIARASERVKLDGILASAAAGLRRSLLTGRRILQMLGGIFSGRVSAKNLGGPVMIFQISYTAAKRDFMHFLYFLGILSVNLAILNILPIPVLDGGHLLFILIEAIRRKPLSERSMAAFQWAGFLFLMLLMAFVIAQDFGRLFG